MYDSNLSCNLPKITNIGYFDSNIAKSGMMQTPNKTIDIWQIELFTENGGTAIINEHEYPNNINKMLVAPKGSLRSSKLHYKCYYIHLCVENGLYLDEMNQLPLFVDVEDNPKQCELFKQMIYCFYSNSADDHLLLNKLLLGFINSMIVTSKQTKASKLLKNNDYVQLADNFMRENLGRNISLDDIAAAAAMSPVYFHKKYTSTKNMTPHEYLCRLRVDHAKYLLISGDTPLQSIAFDCGFGSQAYFNCFFKARVGTTPGVFRNNNSRKTI